MTSSIFIVSLELSISSITLFATVSDITSVVLKGLLSTWQCEHAWLQNSPMLICKIVVGLRFIGETPFSWTNCANSGTFIPVKARRRLDRSSFVNAAWPSVASRPFATWNSSSVSISRSVVGTKLPNSGEVWEI